jgi:ATP-binding protein involved in chromosome partitioning
MLGVSRTEEPKGWQEFWPVVTAGQEPEVRPLERYGLKVISAGFLISGTRPVHVESSQMVGRLVESMLYMVDWGSSDTMIIDLPPGSQEPMTTIVSSTEVAGGIVVTTPQDVARGDATREINRFKQSSVRLLGVLENMSYFVCRHCGERQEVFHKGERYGELDAASLGEVPLDAEISAHGDSGRPLLLAEDGSPANTAFFRVADETLRRLQVAG